MTDIKTFPIPTTPADAFVDEVRGYRDGAKSYSEASANWAEGTEPGGPGTKSAKDYAAAAQAAAITADVHKADFTALDGATDIIVGQVVRVRDGENGRPEDGLTVPAATYTADGALVRDLPGSGLQWVTYRREFADLAEMLADPRTLADMPAGTFLTTRSDGGRYSTVAASGSLGKANAGGVEFDIDWNAFGTSFDGFGPAGDNVTDDQAEIQQAISQARASGNKLSMPPKMYASSGLSIDMTTYTDNPFIIDGAGYNAFPYDGGSAIRYLLSSGSALSMLGTSANNQDGSIELRSFAVVGANAQSGNAAGANGLDAKYANHTILRDFNASYHGGYGARLDTCFSVEVDSGLYFANFASGIHVKDAGNNVLLRKVRAFRNGRDPSLHDQANISINGTSNTAYAPKLDAVDVSYSGRSLFKWTGGDAANISSITVASGTATVVTDAAHGLTTNDWIGINRNTTTGLNTGYVGKQITVVNPTTFSFACSAADGTYTSVTDPNISIGTNSHGLILTGTQGAVIDSLYCEYPQSTLAAYVGSNNDAMTFRGGFLLDARLHIDAASNVEIGGIRFDGANAGVVIGEANERPTINLKASTCIFANGATVVRGAFYMEDGVRYGPRIPISGTWKRGEVLMNSGVNAGAIPGWVCVAAGTPGAWQPLPQTPSVYVNWGDADATLTVGSSFQTNLWQSPLTANRTVTLSTSNAFDGAKFRVSRGKGSTGAFTLDVGGLVALSTGQWCDLEWAGSAWKVTASGDLL